MAQHTCTSTGIDSFCSSDTLRYYTYIYVYMNALHHTCLQQEARATSYCVHRIACFAQLGSGDLLFSATRQPMSMLGSKVANIGRLCDTSSALFVCFIQERFRPIISGYPAVIDTAKRLVKTAQQGSVRGSAVILLCISLSASDCAIVCRCVPCSASDVSAGQAELNLSCRCAERRR